MFVDWERWNRQMYRYPNNFGYFKTEFHLTIYLHAMLVTKGRGWDGKICNQLQTPHGCYILPWPGTGSAATNAESWNTKSIFTLCFVVRIILEPYQFEMLLAWGCLVHHTAANSVCSFHGLGSVSTLKSWFAACWHQSQQFMLSFVKSGTRTFITVLIVFCFQILSLTTPIIF